MQCSLHSAVNWSISAMRTEVSLQRRMCADRSSCKWKVPSTTASIPVHWLMQCRFQQMYSRCRLCHSISHQWTCFEALSTHSRSSIDHVQISGNASEQLVCTAKFYLTKWLQDAIASMTTASPSFKWLLQDASDQFIIYWTKILDQLAIPMMRWLSLQYESKSSHALLCGSAYRDACGL